MSVDVADNHLRFTFHRGAPDARTLAFLAGNRGEFTVRTRGGAIWFTDRDIVRATAGVSAQQGLVRISVTPDATRRVRELSQRAVGHTAEVMLDGRVLTTPRVTMPLGGHLEVLVGDVREARQVATILRHGRLPAGVSIVENVH